MAIEKKIEGVESVYDLISGYDYLHDAEIHSLAYDRAAGELALYFTALYTFDADRDWYVESVSNIRIYVHGFKEAHPIEREKLVGYSVYSFELSADRKLSLVSSISAIEGTFESVDALLES